jgi:hypothetical protein
VLPIAERAASMTRDLFEQADLPGAAGPIEANAALSR